MCVISGIMYGSSICKNLIGISSILTVLDLICQTALKTLLW
jgi:hypothetical protein